MGYCPICHGQNGDLANDSKLCSRCKKIEEEEEKYTPTKNYSPTRALQSKDPNLKEDNYISRFSV